MAGRFPNSVNRSRYTLARSRSFVGPEHVVSTGTGYRAIIVQAFHSLPGYRALQVRYGAEGSELTQYLTRQLYSFTSEYSKFVELFVNGDITARIWCWRALALIIQSFITGWLVRNLLNPIAGLRRKKKDLYGECRKYHVATVWPLIHSSSGTRKSSIHKFINSLVNFDDWSEEEVENKIIPYKVQETTFENLGMVMPKNHLAFRRSSSFFQPTCFLPKGLIP